MALKPAFIPPAYEAPKASADATFAPLVLDSAAIEGMARYRECTVGALRVSGSAQFSQAGWEWLRAHVAQAGATAFVMVDLRNESHGFLNGAAVSWYAREGNWGAAGLPPAEARELERLRLALLARSAEACVSTKQQALSGGPGGERWSVGDVSSEQALVERGGAASYVRIGVDDHCPPTAPAVGALLGLFASLRPGSHVHFHCRGGKGRTATAMALLDIHHHAAREPLAAIVQRQEAVSGYVLHQALAPGVAKAAHQESRWQLLESFHRYCATPQPGGR